MTKEKEFNIYKNKESNNWLTSYLSIGAPTVPKSRIWNIKARALFDDRDSCQQILLVLLKHVFHISHKNKNKKKSPDCLHANVDFIYFIS